MVASFPIQGDEGVPVDAPLQLVFDQPMDETSLVANVTIEPAVEGEGHLITPERFVFRARNWQRATRYTVTVQDARSAAGRPMAEIWQVEFATNEVGRVPLPILMYHRLRELSADAGASVKEWTTAPDMFAAHLAYLDQHGFRVVRLLDIVAYLEDNAPLPAQPIAITFDDGYADFYEVGWPTLQQYGYVVTIFVIPSHVGYGAFLTWEQIAELDRAGVTVGSHTMDHVSLRGLSSDNLTWQLEESKRQLESHITQTVTCLSFPYGAYDEAAIEAARAAGYILGVTINPSRYQVRGRPFQLNRIHVPYDASLEAFAATL